MRKLGVIKLNFWISALVLGISAGGSAYLIYSVSSSEAFIADVSATRGQYNEVLNGRSLEAVDIYRE